MVIAGLDHVAVAGDELAGAVLVEGTGARVERLAARAGDLEPAAPVDGEVERVGGLGQRALDVQVADADGAHAEADLRALRHHVLAAAVGHALGALRLVDQIGEFGAGALERGRVDVGDVVGDDLNVGLLGGHAGRGDG